MGFGRNLYIICSKCGSDDVLFRIDKDLNVVPDPEDPQPCGVWLTCNNCSTLTSVEEFNDNQRYRSENGKV